MKFKVRVNQSLVEQSLFRLAYTEEKLQVTSKKLECGNQEEMTLSQNLVAKL